MECSYVMSVVIILDIFIYDCAHTRVELELNELARLCGNLLRIKLLRAFSIADLNNMGHHISGLR